MRLKINNYRDRQDIIRALVSSGYKVWVEEKFLSVIQGTDYWICAEEIHYPESEAV